MRYDTYARIDIDALEYNINQMKAYVAPSKVQAVLKADAYGHIAKEIFKYLVDFGIEYFAVANLIEALELRGLNRNVDILVFGRVNKENLPLALKNNISLTIFSKEGVDSLIEVIKENPKCKANIHIKINTGFNRLGFDNKGEDIEKIVELGNCERVNIAGIFSHLALSTKEEDKVQLQYFQEVCNQLEKRGLKLGIKHIADSIAGVDYPWARLDMVRLGAALYGIRTPRKAYDSLNLKGTLSMVATISQIRNIKKGDGISYDYLYRAKEDAVIATVTVGYADGIPRSLCNGGAFFINGCEAKVVGLMCMDQCMIDITHIDDVQVGDEVLLFDLDANSYGSIAKMSAAAATNRNEILSGIGKRVPRIYNYKGKTRVVNQLLPNEID